MPVRLISDAGGNYIYKKNTGNASIPVDLEEAYLLASDADMWLNVGMVNTLDELEGFLSEICRYTMFQNRKGL